MGAREVESQYGRPLIDAVGIADAGLESLLTVEVETTATALNVVQVWKAAGGGFDCFVLEITDDGTVPSLKVRLGVRGPLARAETATRLALVLLAESTSAGRFHAVPEGSESRCE